MEELRPNGERAKWAIRMICLIAFLHFINIFLEMNQFYILSKLSKGEKMNNKFVDINKFFVYWMEFLRFFANIISCITFIMWFRRAYFNLHYFSKELAFVEKWASYSWFIPIINFYRPFNLSSINIFYKKFDFY
jgi:Domain of unknown function (DUF4328)